MPKSSRLKSKKLDFALLALFSDWYLALQAHDGSLRRSQLDVVDVADDDDTDADIVADVARCHRGDLGGPEVRGLSHPQRIYLLHRGSDGS